MRSRYRQNEEEQKLDDYDSYYKEESGPMKVKVKKEAVKDGKLKIKGKSSIRTMIKAAKSRD